MKRPRPTRKPLKPSAPTQKQRWRQLLVLLLLPGGGLLGWGTFVLLVNSSQPSSAHIASSTQPTSTRAAPTTQVTPPPAATATPFPDWERFDGDGFHLDLPAALSGQHPVYINDGTGMTVTWGYEDHPLTTPLQHLESETNILLSYSTKITDTDICPESGTPVTLASGFVGRQQTDVPPNANGPGQPYLYVWLSVVMNGLAIRLEMDGNDPADTFFARYNVLWQHMLGSLATSPSTDIPPHNHPCG